MRDIFAPIYETLFGIYKAEYDLIFKSLYLDGGYVNLGLIFVLIPLALWLVFYLAWRYPYGRFGHWFLWLIISCIVVIGVSWGCANSEIFATNNQELLDALNDADSGYELYAKSLPLKYALINGGLAFILGFIYSLILKRLSKIQIHLPF